MAKKTSRTKKTTRRKATSKKEVAPGQSASARKKTSKKKTSKKKTAPQSEPKQPSQRKAPTVSKASDSSPASKKKAPSVRKKRTTARSSASAAAAALAAVQNQHNNGQENGPPAEEWTEARLRKVKTGLKKKDLEYFRGLLMEKRAEIIGDVLSLRNSNSGGAGNLSNMPLHMADVGSDNYEQEFTLGLVEWERKLLNEIDNAIERINNGTYGVCLQSGQPIPYERLEIKPWAKYTIDVVRERERRGLPT